MKATQQRTGFITYEKEESDHLRDNLDFASQLYAQSFDDRTASQVPYLFPMWTTGQLYLADARLSDGAGNLYKVVQEHTSRADWPMDSTTSLYTPLGTTVDDPDAVVAWVQPTGAHDAYADGDLVAYNGKTYESLMDGNVWAPSAYPAGWAEVS